MYTVDVYTYYVVCIYAFLSITDSQILHKGLSSENLMIGSEFYLKLTGMQTDNSSRHKEPAMRQLKRTASVSVAQMSQTTASTCIVPVYTQVL